MIHIPEAIRASDLKEFEDLFHFHAIIYNLLDALGRNTLGRNTPIF